MGGNIASYAVERLWFVSIVLTPLAVVMPICFYEFILCMTKNSPYMGTSCTGIVTVTLVHLGMPLINCATGARLTDSGRQQHKARNTHTCIYLHCDSLQRLHPALWLKQTTNQQSKSRVQAAAINALSSYAGKLWHVGTRKTEKCSPDSSSTMSLCQSLEVEWRRMTSSCDQSPEVLPGLLTNTHSQYESLVCAAH
ncbi:uncharacterized protein RDI95_001158 [Morus bassanus]